MLARAFVILLSLHFALLPARLLASQGSLFSPTTGTVSGLQLTNNYNGAIDALNTGNSGASAPTNQLTGVPSLGNRWLNTTTIPYPMSIYDGANWLTPYWIDATNHTTNVKIGGGAASIASASTVDLCGSSVAPMAYLTITGNTTITSFGSTCKAGHLKVITFSGALTLTYNAASLIIPGAANVITTAGDQAVVASLGAGNFQIVSYTPANGQALINPAVDLGTYVFTSATTVPSSKYLFAYGQTVSRTTYASLMAVQTITQSVTRTNGSPTLTGFTDTTQISNPLPIEGAGIPPATLIVSCTSTTCTMNQNATSSGTANVTVFPNGNGDGSTTFHLPDCRGSVLAGRDNMNGTPRGALTSTYYGVNPDALGAFGGTQSKTISTTNLPPYTPAGSVSTVVTLNPQGNGPFFAYSTFGSLGLGGSASGGLLQAATASATSSFTGTAQGGTNAPLSAIQPTVTANCMIRVLAMAAPMQHFANDNILDAAAIVERRRLAA